MASANDYVLNYAGQTPAMIDASGESFTLISAAFAPPATTIRIMPLGDSITEGDTVPGGYRLPLWIALKADGFLINFVGSLNTYQATGLGDPDHEGHAGYQLSQLKAGIDNNAWLTNNPSDIILLLGGTNDLKNGTGITGSQSDYSNLLDDIILKLPNVKIIMATLTPRADATGSLIAQYNALLPALATSKGANVSLVDQFAAVTLSDISADQIHPNQSGYNKMSPVWEAGIKSLYAGTSTLQLQVNGVTDPTAVNIQQLLYHGGLLWYQNTSNIWFGGKATAAAAWTASTVGDPRSAAVPTTLISAFQTGPSIKDSAGNIWTIVYAASSTATGFQIALNGTTLTGTSNVVDVAYVGTTVWFQNTSLNWFSVQSVSGTTVTFSNGTTTSPLTTKANYRLYTDHPGGAGSPLNIPFGANATWSVDGDLDQADARHFANINTSTNFGVTAWESLSATDPTATLTGSIRYNVTDPNTFTTTNYNIVAHMPAGSYNTGPRSGDNPYGLFDTINHPGMAIVLGAGNGITNFQQGQGPYTSLVGYDDATSDLWGNTWDGGTNSYDKMMGAIRGYDLDPARNPNYPQIRHGLQYMTDKIYYKANAPIPSDGPLASNSWPRLWCDYQGTAGAPSGNQYSGHLIYGATLGIPISVVLPALNPLTGLAWTAAGKAIFWCMQHYPMYPRDQASGGLVFVCDQDASVNFASWISDANADMFALVAYVRVLRNQHIGGSSFTTAPANGPGARVDAGPPPLGSATIVAPPPPANTLTLLWTASTGSPVISYQPNFRVTGATNWIPYGSPILGLTIAITGLAYSTSYDFSVVALNPAGSATSGVVTGATLTGPVTAPSPPGSPLVVP